jgi:hypothetical protein
MRLKDTKDKLRKFRIIQSPMVSRVNLLFPSFFSAFS